MEETDEKRRVINRRLVGMGTVVFLIMGMLVFNLWHLQITKAAYYTAMATSNFDQTAAIPATRGDIIDNKGTILATSIPKFALNVNWNDLQQGSGGKWQDVIYKLARYIKSYWPHQKESVELINEDMLAMIQNQQWERYKPVEIMQTDDQELRAVIAEHKEELPGISVTAEAVRSYPAGSLMGHELGYVREISEDEIDQFNSLPEVKAGTFKYQAGDIVGKSGVEKSYDYWLRGTEGNETIETDSNGQPITEQIVKEPEAGKTVQLTLDSDLQKVMEDSLDAALAAVREDGHPNANAGAAVAIDVNTGKVLAMASHPTMNPNDLIGIISDETAAKYFTDKEAASLNRAISGTYPPGSTFKMITGMAALQSDVTNPSEQIFDDISSLGDPSQGFPEWGNNHFGMVDLKEAIAQSSDIYFEVMGERVFDKNPELVGQIAGEFGLGVNTGIDLPAEAKGILPTPEVKKNRSVPVYEQNHKQGLAEANAEFDPKIANAKDETEKRQLEKDKQERINEIEKIYHQNMYYDIFWHKYDSYNSAIGQGMNAFTPLQLANYVATIANGGKHYQPFIVDKIIDPITKKVVKQNKPTLLNKVSVSPANLDAIKQGMRATVTEGTASFLSRDIPNFTGGAKTGTAQIGSKDTILGNTYNGMFVAFAPYDNPQIAFAGVVEYGEHGSDTAGKIAEAVFKAFFAEQNK